MSRTPVQGLMASGFFSFLVPSNWNLFSFWDWFLANAEKHCDDKPLCILSIVAHDVPHVIKHMAFLIGNGTDMHSSSLDCNCNVNVWFIFYFGSQKIMVQNHTKHVSISTCNILKKVYYVNQNSITHKICLQCVVPASNKLFLALDLKKINNIHQ